MLVVTKKQKEKGFACVTCMLTKSVSFLMQPHNNLMFHHIRQGEASRISAHFASFTGWAAVLTAAGLSAGIYIVTACAE